MRKKRSVLVISLVLALIIGFLLTVFLLVRDDKIQTASNEALTAQTEASSKEQTSELPKVSSDSWELVLVNRDNTKEEMNPDVTQIGNIYVDSRIADAVQGFLAEAQTIDPSEHLISGYRSVAYQESLFNSYVAQEMAANPNLTQAEAEEVVKTYSQPAGASEHQTGLAIDMSTVDSLNESDPNVVAKIQEIAPKYGFILRFPEGKSDSTGVDYEDWHFRYVGPESAKYITEHNLTLEEYIALLKENNQ